MFKLAAYLKKYRKQCILGPIFKFLEAIFELLLPTIMALIINQGVARRDSSEVLRLGGLMIVLAVCGYFCAFTCQHFAAVASQGFGTTLRNVFFKHILSFSYSQLDEFGTATLTNRITNDINQLQTCVAMMIRLFTRAPFLCIGAIIMSFFLDVKLALLLLCSMPVLCAIIYFITRFASPHYREYQRRLDRIARVLRENLSGVRVIRAFSKTEDETRRFNKANDELTDTGLAIGRISSFFNPLTALTVNLVIVLILWIGGLHIDAGTLSQGQIIAFINYVSQILYALLVISNLIIMLTKTMASAARINEVLDTPADAKVVRAGAAHTEDTQSPAVQFKDVSFGYNRTGEKVLENITFDVRRGETLGIIGGTGSGKTTLVSLIPRFYGADGGEVRVLGRNVADFPAAELHRTVGVVPQKTLLFTGTIAENIRMGNPDATEEEVEQAARLAQAEEFIRDCASMYDTKLTRGGANLSGGQRQRLTIARALALDPEILILDDASSALDYLTDSKLRRAVREDSPGRTIILVSQRAGVVKNADRILVLQDGRIAGIGPHGTLIRECDVYRKICLSQLSDEEAGL